MSKYATGKHSKAISDRSGMEFPYREMVREWNGSFVHYTEFEPKQPQLEPKPIGGDGVALLQVRPDRTEPITTVMIPQDGFKTYQAGSGIINVNVPGHGLTNGTTYLFRGAPTTSPGTGTPTNPVFAYGPIPNFDGITGAQITQGSGYAITTGLFQKTPHSFQQLSSPFGVQFRLQAPGVSYTTLDSHFVQCHLYIYRD